MAGRLQLVKSVIQGMLVYTLLIYKWPKNMLHRLDMFAKNFIYTGDIYQRLLISVQWKKTCKPFTEGGLAIRLLLEFNEVGLRKLGFDFIKRQTQWSKFMSSKFYHQGVTVRYYKSSSVWPGILSVLPSVQVHVCRNT